MTCLLGVDTKPPAPLHDSGDLMVTGSGSQVSPGLSLVIITPILGSDLLTQYIPPGHTSDSLRVCGPWPASGPLGDIRPQHQLRLRGFSGPGLQFRSLASPLARVPGPGLRHDHLPRLSLQLTRRQVRHVGCSSPNTFRNHRANVNNDKQTDKFPGNFLPVMMIILWSCRKK